MRDWKTLAWVAVNVNPSASLHMIKDHMTMIFQYADDFIIMPYKIDFDLAMKNLRLKTIEFRERCENLNLSFNLSKTNTMYFAKNSINNIEPSIDGVKIQQRPKLKFLSRIVKN